VKTTVAGVATKVGEIAVEQNRFADITGAHSFRSLALELPPDGVAIDCDHDHVARGQLIYAELGADNALRCVAVLDGDEITKVGQDVFFSAELEMRGDVDRAFYVARQAALIGLSLTLSPALLGAQSIEIRTGDLRSRVDRGSWPTSWRWSSPLLARAHDFLDAGYGIEKRAARIVDIASEKQDELAAAEWERERRWVETRSPAAKRAAEWERHSVGARIEWSRHRGRVIRVS
jgi:hypothetical protein